MTRKKIFSILKFSAFLLLGFFLLWLVFRRVELKQVIYEFTHANYWWLLLSWFFALVSHFARAVRWNLLIRSLGYKTNNVMTFYAVMAGYFANVAFPRLGEIVRCGILSRRDKIPMNNLLGSVVAERVFDVIVLLVIMFLVIVFQFDVVGGFVDKYVFTPLYYRFSNNLGTIVLIFSVILLLIAICIVLIRLFIHRIKKLSFYEKFNNFILGFISGLKTIQRLKQKIAFLFWTFIIWLGYLMMTYVVFFAIDATSSLSLADGLTILVIGSLGMLAPVPGGLGAYHFFVSLILFELYAVPKAPAASWATLNHASQGILILLIGAFSYFMIFVYKRKKNGKSANYSIKDIRMGKT